jgi:peptidylprolyl isomerase
MNKMILPLSLLLSLNIGATTMCKSDSCATKSTPGLRFEIVSPAKDTQAKSPKAGDVVTVHYTGWLEERDKNGNPVQGKKFDSSKDRGTPFQFVIGRGQVIQGWDQGVMQMKVGETRRLIIPPSLAYGNRAVGAVIPANATLIFDVELLGIK